MYDASARSAPMSWPEFLQRVGQVFLDLAQHARFADAYPMCASMKTALTKALRADDDAIEHAVTGFYAALHAADAGYTDEELVELKSMRGYGCHAGGLTPIHHAGAFISPGTVSADYGAGNGLQGLLLQAVYPHRRTVQIEISGGMIQRGRRLQSMMGIADERVHWLRANIAEVPPDGFDFIYMYLPCRPEGEGEAFYRDFSRRLTESGRNVMVFSVADCLKRYADSSWKAVHDDGHLACFIVNGDCRFRSSSPV